MCMAEQAKQLTSEMALRDYGNWHWQLDKAIDYLTRIANSRNFGATHTLSEHRNMVCMHLGCVITMLKPPDKFTIEITKRMYPDTIKGNETKAIENSVQYHYVRKHASNVFHSTHHVLLRLLMNATKQRHEFKYVRYLIKDAVVKAHVLTD
jgi:hypothetical protein